MHTVHTLTRVPFKQENQLLSNPTNTTIEELVTQLPGGHFILRAELHKYIDKQLDVSRLNVIHDKLWRAGLPGKIFPLHHQKVLHRHIVASERIDLHLVWYVFVLRVQSDGTVFGTAI